MEEVLGLGLLEGGEHEIGVAEISLAEMESIRARGRFGETPQIYPQELQFRVGQ